MRVVHTLSLAALWGTLAVVPAAPAATLTYTDRGVWNDAVTNRTDVNFDLLSGYHSSVNEGTPPDEVNIAPLGYPLLMVSSGWGPAGSGSYLTIDSYVGGRQGFTVTHSSGIDTAFGVNLWTFDDQEQPIEIKVYSVGQPSSPVTYTVNTLDTSHPAIFFGYTSDDKIDHIEITTTGPRSGPNTPYAGRVVLDNYSWGQLNSADPPPPTEGMEAPEATSLGYLAIGIAAMMFGKRKFARAE